MRQRAKNHFVQEKLRMSEDEENPIKKWTGVKESFDSGFAQLQTFKGISKL
jgi:hypothetical protein